jgi:hypothetical protein
MPGRRCESRVLRDRTVEATLATARVLAEERTSALLHVGIAGAASLEPGTVVVGSESIYCDVLDSNSTLPRVAHLTPSPALVDAARTALPYAVTAPIATAARVGGGTEYPVEAMEDALSVVHRVIRTLAPVLAGMRPPSAPTG